jgi:hypothetical protein
MKVPPSSLQREPQDLTDAGILKSHRQGRMVYYQANQDSPLYSGQLRNSSRHRLTFGMLPSEQVTCRSDHGEGNAAIKKLYPASRPP